MSWQVRLTEDAESDLERTYDYYEGQRAGLGLRFLATVRKSLEVLEEMPLIFGEIIPDVRFHLVDPFQQVIYYVVLDDTVHVIGVIHAKRDPRVLNERWKGFFDQAE